MEEQLTLDFDPPCIPYPSDSFIFKRTAIENCLFGVDIDQGALDMCKTRLMLGLVAEADHPAQLRDLEFNLRCDNALLMSDEDFADMRRKAKVRHWTRLYQDLQDIANADFD